MKLFNKILLIFFGACWWGNVATAVAPLTIEITGGQISGIPIAVIPFKIENADSLTKNKLTDVAQVIHQNLRNSGQFQPLARTEMPIQPAYGHEVDYAYWQSLGVDNVLVGRIRQIGADNFTVEFEFIDVYKPGKPPALSQRFTGITLKKMRELAHHISDQVFEKRLAVKGIFSTRIAYVSVNQIDDDIIHTLHVADADGFNPRVLKQSKAPIMSPTWAPNGRSLAYVSLDNHRASIEMANLDTGKVEVVSHFPGINGAPSFSPDGQKMAIVLSKTGVPKIYVLDLRSKSLTQITRGTSIDTEPSWDWSGQSLVFTSNRGGAPQIYRVNLANNEVNRLTFEGRYNARASLTPDGKKLIMMHKTDDDRFTIAVQNLDTNKVKILTHARTDESPSLAPNAMMVLYGAKEADRGILGAVSLDGRFRMRLPSPAGSVQEPSWSPFLL